VKKKRGRGRPKGAKKKSSGEPHNYAYWYWTLKNPETVNAFLERGSEQQKESIKEIISYAKRYDPDFFEEVKGEEILERMK